MYFQKNVDLMVQFLLEKCQGISEKSFILLNLPLNKFFI